MDELKIPITPNLSREDLRAAKKCLKKISANPEDYFRGELSPDNVKLTEIIAEGGSGTVYKGELRSGYSRDPPTAKDKLVNSAKNCRRHQVAIKHFSDNHLGFNNNDMMREITIMSLIQHPNIIQFHGACTRDPERL